MPGRLPELVALESRLPGYAAGATGLIHGDLRVDNVLIDADGRAWFCDWTWVCSGPAWFDLAGLLLTAYASGLDADRLFAAHPATAGAPPDALDATLAALAGYFLTGAAAAPPTASPHLPAAPAVERRAGARLAGPTARAGGDAAGRERGGRSLAGLGDAAVAGVTWLRGWCASRVLARPGRPGNLALRAAMTHVRHHAHKLTNPSYQDEAVAWRTSSPRSSATGRTRSARLRNKSVKSSLKTAIRKFHEAAEAGDAEKATALHA